MKKMSTRLQAVMLAIGGMLVSASAFAQENAGAAAEVVRDQLGSFADLATGGAFLVGIFVGIASLMKFKAYNENPQQTKISTPIILALVAAGLIGLPAFLNMSRGTILEDEGGSLEGSVYQNIG